jgi:hypothetical protein
VLLITEEIKHLSILSLFTSVGFNDHWYYVAGINIFPGLLVAYIQNMFYVQIRACTKMEVKCRCVD